MPNYSVLLAGTGELRHIVPEGLVVTYKFSLGTGELLTRMRTRLRGNATANRVVWQNADGQRLLLYTDTFTGRFLAGWLVLAVDCQTDQTGRQTMQVVYCLGKEGEADGVQAASAVNTSSTGGAQIAAVWGADLQRVIWDAVLDAVEAAVHRAAASRPKDPITIKGFHCTPDLFHAEVIAGDR